MESKTGVEVLLYEFEMHFLGLKWVILVVGGLVLYLAWMRMSLRLLFLLNAEIILYGWRGVYACWLMEKLCLNT